MPRVDVTLRNPRDHAIAAYADELAAEIAKTAAQHDAAGSFPHDHFDTLTQRGALRLTVPQAHGGEGYSLYETLIFQERLARGSGSTALALGWHLMVFGYLGHTLRWQPEALASLAADAVQRGQLINVLVTEREAGNLLRGARPGTVARRVEGGYVLSGRKAFCSSAPRLQKMIVYAWVEDEGRVAEFLVPRTEGVRVIENWNTLGMRSTGSHDIKFDQVQLAPEALLSYIELGQVGSFTVASRAYGLQLSAVYLGVARAARDFALGFADRYQPRVWANRCSKPPRCSSAWARSSCCWARARPCCMAWSSAGSATRTCKASLVTRWPSPRSPSAAMPCAWWSWPWRLWAGIRCRAICHWSATCATCSARSSTRRKRTPWWPRWPRRPSPTGMPTTPRLPNLLKRWFKRPQPP